MNFDLPTQQFVGFIPLIERYLIAEDKQQFLNQLPKEGTQHAFLQLFLNNHDWQTNDQLAKKLGLSYYDQKNLQKLYSTRILLDDSGSNKDRDLAIDLIKKELNLNFDYYKPTNASNQIQQDNQALNLESELKAENYSLEKYLQRNTYEGVFASVTELGLSKLNKDKILSLTQQNLESVVNTINLASLGDKGLEILRRYFDVNNQRNKNFVLPPDIYRRLTLEQLERLPGYVGGVVNSNEYIHWRYKKSIGYQMQSEFLEVDNRLYSRDKLKVKKQILKKGLSWLKDSKLGSVESFIDQLLLELLSVNILLEEPDLDVFLEYLRRPRTVVNCFSDDYRTVLNSSRQNYFFDYYWVSVHGLDPSGWNADTELIQKYLNVYFKHHSDINNSKQFEKYFTSKFINKTLYRVRLEKGEKTENIHAVFSKEEEADLKNKKQLTISDRNQKKFGVKENVVLKLLVKNISEITAEIYEISTQKHYLNSTEEIDNSISLEFLEPLKKVSLKVENDNPFKVTEVEFNLTEHLGARNSIFIINFQGDGILSRAVIRRGSIVALSRQTLAGIDLRFYEEDGTSINQLDVWLRGRKVHVKDKYTIPYGQSREMLNLIAVKDEYAELIRVEVQEESYKWNVSYTYHEENFLVGSKAKILIHAQLSSNSGRVSTQAVKDTSIVVNILNHLGIPSSLSFNNIKWDSKNEYQLQIPIQTYLKSIMITVKGKVDKYVGQPQELVSQKSINFKDETGTLNFVEFFLSSTTDGFILNLLGKNGEPKPSISVNIDVFSKLFNSSIQFTLITDKNGQIKLGKLNNIKSLNAYSLATTEIPSAYGTWNFDGIANEVVYSRRITQKEGEEFFLPVYSDFHLENEVILLKVNQANQRDAISNQTHRLRFDDSRLHASLPKGVYILNFLTLSKSIVIQVTKLDQWGNSNQFINKNTRIIYTLPAQSQDPISLSKDFNKEQDGNQYKVFLKLQVKDKKHLDNVRIHVIASTFTYGSGYSKDIAQTTMQETSKAVSLKLKRNVCSYLNDKELSDEHCYILNREKDEKFIGNNLERPRVLLKRTFNRDTTVKKQELAGEKDYASILLDNLSAGSKPLSRMAEAHYRNPSAPQRIQTISLFNNFLKHPSLIIPNQHGQTIEFTIPKHYQSFIVIVASPNFAFEKLYSLNSSKFQTNNLISVGLKEVSPKQAYTISRECYKLQKGQNLTVKRSSQWTSVSGSNLQILSQINNSNIFEWVMNWPSYTEEKKLKIYDKFVCHELNTYIKYKDSEFFNRVVKDFISNKLEKGVVDYCLIGDKRAQKYSKLDSYNRLNAFEKCLVIEYLAQNGQLEKAKSMADGLALEFKSFKLPYSQFENKFDIIMTSKQIADVPVPMPEMEAFAAGGGYAMKQMKMMECQVMKMCQRAELQMDSLCCLQDQQQCDFDEGGFEQQLEQRKKFKPGFQQVQKTKEYVQTTYYQMKQPEQSTYHIPLSKFWVDLAEHFVNPKNTFVSQNFIYLTSRQQLSLAVGFLPLPLAAEYSIKADNEDVVITAQSPFIVFVKEIKSMGFENKYGVLINQRISDPNDEYEYEEDGTMLEKRVGEFIKDKPYYLKTVVTNTSTANLELQILIDIPQGSIPIGSNEYTQVISEVIGAYQTRSFQNGFYFPKAGEFNLYPANASKNRHVVSKATLLEKIIVKDERSVKKLETLNDVLVSGSKDDILNFLRTKNIFDSATFNMQSILWLLKEKDMYEKISKILNQRSYYSRSLYEFGFLHKDKEAIKDLLEGDSRYNPFYERVFEYYPLTSQRVHKFMKAEKSTILNETFKQTYEKFLVDSLATRRTNKPFFLIVFTYYLILQDRVKEANQVFKTLSNLKDEKDFPFLQYDYVTCFLDMYTGYPNFAVARNISSSYVDKNYPVETWRKMFKEVNDLLSVHDVTVYEEETNEEHDIKIAIKGNKLSVFLPEKTTVEINFHAVNLELMFSNSPFDDAKLFSTIKPFKTVTVTSEKGGEQLVNRPEGHANIYVHPVELSSIKQGQHLASFLWPSDSVKVKILEDEGVAVVFVDGKPKPGAYCKVYAKGNQTRFYKDGYTDIQGRFKYVSQLDDVQKFAILVITDQGGITKLARIPSKNGVIG